MLRSVRKDLELTVADRWSGCLGDIREIQDTRKMENKCMGVRVKTEGGEGGCVHKMKKNCLDMRWKMSDAETWQCSLLAVFDTIANK